MKLTELVSLLRATGYPVAFSHFKVDSNNPAPSLPFVTYLTPSTENLIADNEVYQKVLNIEIELYTKNKDLTAESTLENMLNENELPFDYFQLWLESEQVFQTIYEVRMINYE